MLKPKTEFLKARITPELKKDIYKRAERNERTLSGEIAYLLKLGIERTERDK